MGTIFLEVKAKNCILIYKLVEHNSEQELVDK